MAPVLQIPNPVWLNHAYGSPVSVTLDAGFPALQYLFALNAQVTDPEGNWEWTSGWVDNIALSNLSDTPAFGEMIDPRDNRVYPTVTLGDQVWMAENLAWLGTPTGG